MTFSSSLANKRNLLISLLPLKKRVGRHSIASSRYFSFVSQHEQQFDNDYGKPLGKLLGAKLFTKSIVGKSVSMSRTFSPQSNAQTFLICGGPLLAAHASFDPIYDRARTYIANRPVGNMVLSPVLISGLVGALVEASFPESFLIDERMQQFIPLIVGVSCISLF